MWDGMQDALRIILTDTGAATTDVITHRYGEEAGRIAKEGTEVGSRVARDILERNLTSAGHPERP